MSRYIDAELLKEAVRKNGVAIDGTINELPHIYIVRCKECKWQTKDQYDEPYCGFHSIGIYADDYCSYGEREGE